MIPANEKDALHKLVTYIFDLWHQGPGCT